MLQRQGIDFAKKDFFDLDGHDVGLVLDAAKRARYRGSSRSGKSTGRAYFDLLRRQKGCR